MQMYIVTQEASIQIHPEDKLRVGKNLNNKRGKG